jgi:hypothetical protein
MNDFVVMPKADWEDVLNATREKANTDELMLSSEVGDKIRSLSLLESVGDYDLTVKFYVQTSMNEDGSYGEGLQGRTGYYQVNYGAARFFENLSIIPLVDVARADDTVTFVITCLNNVVIKSTTNCTADVTCDTDYETFENINYINITTFSGDASVSVLLESY